MLRYKGTLFHAPKWRKCAQCQQHIAVGDDAWSLDYHVFCSPECVDTWADISSLL